MSNNSIFSQLLAVIILIGFIACQKAEKTQLVFDENIFRETDLVGEFVTTEGQTVLGDVIDIPYSIENLLKAYDNLPAQTKSQINPNDIQPTHYYVRFYPKSIEEQDILRNIKPYVFLSETPLDRKVVVGGSSYHDPSIPEDLPTFQYTVVPVARWAELERTVPIEAEILIKAYIPDYDEAYTTKSEEKYGIPATAYEALLQEAYRITGNEYDVIPETKSSWNPSGRIRAYDTEKAVYVPVKGVRVRGTHLLKVKEALTDTSGYFSLAAFSNPVNMKVVWESDDWDIRDGSIGQATFDGPQLNNQSWYCDIGESHEKNIRYAVIQNVAFKCFYEDIGGLFPPLFSHRLKFCQHSSSGSSNFDCTIMGAEFIDTYILSFGEYLDSKEYSETVAHEIGHSVHYSWSIADYNDHSSIIKESWADFYQFAISYLIYGSFHNTDLFWPNNTTPSTLKYSPIFIDLFDDQNQSTLYPGLVFPMGMPNDNVTGYSWNSLNTILYHSYTISDLKAKAKNPKPYGVTDAQIDSLFVVYEANWTND